MQAQIRSSKVFRGLPETSQGLICILLAQLTWGIQPLFWMMLAGTEAFTAVAHRIIWSCFFAVVLAFMLGHREKLRKILGDRKNLKIALVAGLIITMNWCLYICAILSGHILEVALGLFLTPLTTVIAGVVFLREKLRVWQWISVGLGGVAVGVVTAGYDRFPWLALGIALAIAVYSLLKKHLGYPPLTGLAIETALPAVGAIGFLLFTQSHSVILFDNSSITGSALLVASGMATSIPLAFFAYALRRVPLTTVGIVQYINPVLQFIVGLFIAHEAVSTAKWLGFVLVWAALAVFTTESVRYQRNSMRSREAETVPEPAGLIRSDV